MMGCKTSRTLSVSHFCMRPLKYIVCLALLASGCVYKTGALRRQVHQYQGEGMITDASIGAPPFFWGPGFRIVFPSFDPSRPYQHSYQLKGVPKTKYGASTIYVRFPGNCSPDLDRAKTKITAVLSFAILDENHAVLKSQDVDFSKAVWSWEGGGQPGVFGLWVYDRANNRTENVFTFDPAKLYTLRIVYKPGLVPPQTTNIYVTVENGGRT
jgi:hypothetical protein